MGFVTYATPKRYCTEETTADGQIVWREHINCFAVLHRFDAAGKHIGTDVERLRWNWTQQKLDDWANVRADDRKLNRRPTEVIAEFG